MKTLLAAGADVDAKTADKHERNLVHLAAANGNEDTVVAMIDHAGADHIMGKVKSTRIEMMSDYVTFSNSCWILQMPTVAALCLWPFKTSTPRFPTSCWRPTA